MALVATSASTDFEVKVPALVGVMLPKSNSGGAARARTGFTSSENCVTESEAFEIIIGANIESTAKPKISEVEKIAKFLNRYVRPTIFITYFNLSISIFRSSS